MATPTGPETPPPPGKDASAEAVEADIEQTREDLGHTVEALAEKLDVKSQAQHAVQDARVRATELARTAQARGGELATQARDAVTDDQGKIRPEVALGALTGATVAVVILAVSAWRRKR